MIHLLDLFIELPQARQVCPEFVLVFPGYGEPYQVDEGDEERERVGFGLVLIQEHDPLEEVRGFRIFVSLRIEVGQVCFRKCTLIERLGLGIAAMLLVDMRQVIAVGHQLLVCRSKPRLNEREDVLHERIRLGILTLLQAELDEVVEVIEAGHVWSVCCPQDPFIQRPCLRNVAQVHVQVRQMAQQANGLGVLKTAHALINADGTFQQRLGLPVLILERVDIRQLVEQHRHHGLFRLWQLFSQTQSP